MEMGDESEQIIQVSLGMWHSFSAMDEAKTGLVPKSKLKVFTASIGTLLGCKGAENRLEEHRSTSYLNFHDYLYYINKELLTFPAGSLETSDLKKYRSQIEELSWLVCRKNFLKRDLMVFPNNCVYLWFRVFCYLGQLVMIDNQISEVVMVADEVEHVAKKFTEALGQPHWDSTDFAGIAQVLPTFRFSVFLALLETRYAKNVEVSGLNEAVKDVYDYFVEDVIKKGMLSKKLPVVSKMKERWFVLKPDVLTFHSNRDENDKKGEITITSKSEIETSGDSNSKNHTFQLSSADKKFEFSAVDYKTKAQWIAAMKIAIKESGKKISYQKMLAQKRKYEREALLQKKIEEDRNEEHLKQQLMKKITEIKAETQKRKEAEDRFKREVDLRYKSEKMKKELEDTRIKLEESLQKEKQATRDEEIVRALQARMLNEEWEKREELENMHEVQRLTIEEERKKREELEILNNKQNMILNNYENRLRQLESERGQFERQVKEMKEKVVVAERAKEIIEAKLKVKERNLQQVNNGQLPSNKNLVCTH